MIKLDVHIVQPSPSILELSSFKCMHLFIFVYGCFTCTYVCAPFVCRGPLEASRRCLTPLGLELQRVVSQHVGAESQAQVVWKSTQCSYHQVISLTPFIFQMETVPVRLLPPPPYPGVSISLLPLNLAAVNAI